MSSTWARQDTKSNHSAIADGACEVSSPARSPIDVLIGGPKVDGGLRTTRDNPFMKLCGVLPKGTAADLNKAIADQRRIDPEMWN